MTANDIYKKVLRFCDDSTKVYCYGYGNYGKAVIEFLKKHGRKVDGIIVTHKDDNVNELILSLSEIESNIYSDDGIIFAMSEKNMKSINLNHFRNKLRCLVLKDYEFDEIKKFEYYEFIGKNPRVSYWNYTFDRLKLYIKTSIRRNGLHNKNIDQWHLIPKEQKPYCSEIVDYILEKKTDGSIVELGCGLCDIIGDKRLEKFQRYGLDVDRDVIEEAKLHFPDIDLKCGSFEDLEIKNKLSFFLTVNFLHAISTEELREILERVFSENQINYYIADEVTGNYEYLFHLEDVVPKGYVLDRVIGIHPSDGGVRVIKGFRRNNN